MQSEKPGLTAALWLYEKFLNTLQGKILPTDLEKSLTQKEGTELGYILFEELLRLLQTHYIW